MSSFLSHNTSSEGDGRRKRRRRKRRRRVEPTDDWEQLKLLFGWPEQVRYEELRPLVLFGSSVAERAIEIEAAERTLYRRMDRFETEGMESLFDSEMARHRKLPPTIRRLIVDLKAEHPHLSLGEIASICYVGFGRRPSKHTVKRILEEEPMPLKMARRFDPYHEIEEPMERRMVVVRLHSEGWAPKSIAGYLGMHKSTVYRVLKRWIEEGEQGLEDKPHGRPSGVRKVDLKAIEAIRRLQQNPHLGAFRVHAALAQMGIHLSPATCGRILALNRRLYVVGQTQRTLPREEGDALRFFEATRVLDHRRPLRRAPAGRQHLRHLGLGEPQPGDPRKWDLSQPGSPVLPLCPLLGGGALRLSRSHRHRRRGHLQGQPGTLDLRSPEHRQGRDRAGSSLAIVHRDHLQHPAQDGRLALRKGRELARARGHS